MVNSKIQEKLVKRRTMDNEMIIKREVPKNKRT